MPPRLTAELYDLTVIDQAYGADADLYHDVLRVSHTASDAVIQSAFFDRRSELFSVLSKLSEEDSDIDEIAISQRRFAERRMDAVVMCFRILKDPTLRAMYEGERQRRLEARLKRKSKPNKSASQEQLPQMSPQAVQSFDELIRPVPFDEGKSPKDNEVPVTSRVNPIARTTPSREKAITKVVSATPAKNRTKNVEKKIASKKGTYKKVVSVPTRGRSTIPITPPQSPPSSVVLSKRRKEIHPETETEDENESDGETEIFTDADTGVFTDGDTGVFTDGDTGVFTDADTAIDTDGDTAIDTDAETGIFTELERPTRRRENSEPGVFDMITDNSIVRAISEEVHGAYLDTLSAFDQVLNAFTLDESDIHAVCTRLDKAKQQLTSPIPIENL